jgi:hypothetical protein
LRVLARGWSIALLSVLATLLVPLPASAAPGDVHLLASAGASDSPMYLQPLVETPAGLVFRNTFDDTTWIDPAGAADAEQEDRLTDPTVIGDLLSSYDAGTTTLSWRTIADATLHQTVLPPESTFVTRTPTGYLAEQGDGPYDLVVVDVLAGDVSTAIGTTAEVAGAIAGPLGAAAPNPAVPGEWRYYPYDGSVPAGQLVQAPAAATTCQLTTAHLFCWSASQLTRLPLNGDPGTTINYSVLSLVETSGAVVFTTPDQTFMPDGPPYRHVWHLGHGGSSPGWVARGFEGLTGPLAPVIGGTDLALAAKHEGANKAGIYRLTSAYSVVLVRAAETLPYEASAIALGPGRVAWHDNSHWEGRIYSRDLGITSGGALSVGVTRGVNFRTNGSGLSVSGDRVAYWTTSGVPGLATQTHGGGISTAVRATEVISSTVSGQRMLSRTRDLNGVLLWKLTVASTTTALPDAVSYDLWGERLVWVNSDGSVWLRDLRTAASPLQIAPAIAGGVTEGGVHVAGDLVAWDVTPADDDLADPGVLVRDLATMAPADPLGGLSELQDLSTGYAVGQGCSPDEGCTPRAVSLADGTVTAVETDDPLALDGNTLGFITPDGLPAVQELPAYADDPRILAFSGAAEEVDFRYAQVPLRISASQPLTSCALEMRASNGTLVRTNPCTPAPFGTASVYWNGSGQSMDTMPLGTYSWRIVAANGDRPLVDYDGSTDVLSGTITVVGPVPPEPEPEPEPVPVPLPDLGFAHRLSDGGINLFRMPLSELDYQPGMAQLVRTLPASWGFRTDRARVLAGDFGNMTPTDDGTADHIVWHAGSDGGVRVWAVPGSVEHSAPRLLHTLPRSAGWSWADSRPLVGDLNGDGWDDLLVVHRARVNVVWALLSDGTRLGAPRKWGSLGGDFTTMRNYVADADGDGLADLLATAPAHASFRTTALLTRPNGTAALPAVDSHVANFPTAAGWSLAYSRQLAGDVTADGLADLVTVHRSGTGGVLVWVSENCSVADGDVCWEAPVRWQILSNGWSWTNSRQYLADTDGDYVLDLISVHRSGAGGMFVWRHLSDYSVLRAPERIADLPASWGWRWSLSTESVANTWGWWAAGAQTAGDRGGDVGSTRTTR